MWNFHIEILVLSHEGTPNENVKYNEIEGAMSVKKVGVPQQESRTTPRSSSILAKANKR
jgi:hypothetical protein